MTNGDDTVDVNHAGISVVGDDVKWKSLQQVDPANSLELLCSDKSSALFAEKLRHCDQLWGYLGINETLHEEIHRDNFGNYKNYKHNLLLAWRKQCGCRATYHNLCNIFEEWGDLNIIDIVKKQALKEHLSEQSHSNESCSSQPILYYSEQSCDDGSEVSSVSSLASEYSLASVYEPFEPNPSHLQFGDLYDDIMDDIKLHYKDNVVSLKIKIIHMLNSNSHCHDIPPRHIQKLSSDKNSNTTDGVFAYFSAFIREGKPEVLRLIIEASGCSKAKKLYDDYFGHGTFR